MQSIGPQNATPEQVERPPTLMETPTADHFPTRSLFLGALPGLIGIVIAATLYLYLQPRAASQIAAVRTPRELIVIRADQSLSVTMVYSGYSFGNLFAFGTSGDAFGLQWSPTGRHLAVTARNQEDGGTDTLVTPTSAFSKYPISDTLVFRNAVLVNRAWARDGSVLALWSVASGKPELILYDFAQGRIVSSTAPLDISAPVDWHPAQALLFYTSIAENTPTRTLKLLEPSGAIGDFAPADGQKSRSSVVLSPEGSRMAYIAQPTATLGTDAGQPMMGDLWIVMSDGANARLMTQAGNYIAPSWAPDGNSIFAISVITAAQPPVYMLERVRITDTLVTQIAQIAKPALLGIGAADQLWQWSPTGKLLLFMSMNDKRQSIVVLVNADGSSPRVAYVDTSGGGNLTADWMPTGSAILVSSSSIGMKRIWIDRIRPGDTWPDAAYANWQP